MDAPDPIPPQPWLAELELQIERVREAGGAEAVHEMRIAAGRLSVWIEIAKRRALHDDLRWLRRTAATLRDLDVMLDEGGDGDAAAPGTGESQRVSGLREQRSAELDAVQAELRSSRTRALLEALLCVPAPDLATARKGTRKLAKRVLRAGKRMSDADNDAESMHRVRRRLRRLRYALEWLQADASEIKDVQDAFGILNDRVVEIQHLEENPDVELGAEDRRALAADRDSARKTALETWESRRSLLDDLARGGGALED